MDLEPGTIIRDNLRLVRPLGEGGMGRVWVAEHSTLKMQVAVKFILETFATESPEAIDRFNREARTSAQIKTHHVVQVFDNGVTDDGTPFIVMELLEGENLGERLEQVEVLSLREMATVLRQVARALDKAHQLGIVHRDIKPDNIFLVTSEDELLVKVFDFGIAKPGTQMRGKRLTVPGALVGTPEFMSREQVILGKDDFRADLWALAVVTYLALAGDIPFDGPTVGAICAAIERGKFTPVSELRPDLPAGIDDWFAKALHREPEKRFDSAKEMAIAYLGLVPAEAGENTETWEDTGQYARGEFGLPTDEAHEAPRAQASGPGALAAATARKDESDADLARGDAGPGAADGDGVAKSPWQTNAGKLRREAIARFGPDVDPGMPTPSGTASSGAPLIRRRSLWAALGFGVAAAVAAVVAALMAGEPKQKQCAGDASCPVGQVCVFVEDHAECAPSCKDGKACPWGRICEPCARAGDCPHCNVCVPACLP